VAERRTRTAQVVGQPKPKSATARNSLATQQLVSTLGTDKKAAVTAALETVNERLAWDRAFEQSLRQRYDELAALATSKPKAAPRSASKPALASGPAQRATLEKLDPYQLLEGFGRDHLRAALADTTQRRLRSAVDVVQARHPTTKLPNRNRNEDMIDYIVTHVAGPGY